MMGVVVLGLEVFEFSAWVEAEGVLGPLTAVFEEDKPPERFHLDCSEVEVDTLRLGWIFCGQEAGKPQNRGLSNKPSFC